MAITPGTVSYTDNCPTGSSIQYSNDGGATWQNTAIAYDNTVAQNLCVRCVCDSDPTQVSLIACTQTNPVDPCSCCAACQNCVGTVCENNCPPGQSCDITTGNCVCDLEGEPCDDGDDCTTGTTFDSNCDCVGGTPTCPNNPSISNLTACVAASGQIQITGTLDTNCDVMLGSPCADVIPMSISTGSFTFFTALNCFEAGVFTFTLDDGCNDPVTFTINEPTNPCP